MIAVENITEPFALPEDALCLTPAGWRPEAYRVSIQLPTTPVVHQTRLGPIQINAGPSPGPAELAKALHTIWGQHGNLLGHGDLIFKQTTDKPHPTGYLVFIPTDG